MRNCQSRQRRDPSARRDPLVVSLKFQPGLVVIDPQVAVPTAHDRLRDNPLHLLRDNSDIGFFASIINEAIEAKAVVEMAEQDDLVLKPKIGSPSAATATTSKAASAAVKTASASVEASPKAAAAAVEAAAATVYATAMVHATAVDATAVDAAAIYAAAVPDHGVSRDVGPAASIGTSVKA
jgi:hypothetical protein